MKDLSIKGKSIKIWLRLTNPKAFKVYREYRLLSLHEQLYFKAILGELIYWYNEADPIVGVGNNLLYFNYRHIKGSAHRQIFLGICEAIPKVQEELGDIYPDHKKDFTKVFDRFLILYRSSVKHGLYYWDIDDPVEAKDKRLTVLHSIKRAIYWADRINLTRSTP